ncbi:MAG: hypothetical protein M3O46_16600 [Myxococcota bacterium]|nr:hypothetical protein [Myxococcota bacterium]
MDAAKATTKAKVAAEKTDMASLRIFMDAFVTFVKATFGNAPDVLADFGVHPKARTPLTVEAKAAAAAKRAATRAARHTMGAKQKKGVKGAVTGIVVTPATATHPPRRVARLPLLPPARVRRPPRRRTHLTGGHKQGTGGRRAARVDVALPQPALSETATGCKRPLSEVTLDRSMQAFEARPPPLTTGACSHS